MYYTGARGSVCSVVYAEERHVGITGTGAVVVHNSSCGRSNV